MDKNTLSHYGWVIICIIVIAILLGLATPFGNYVKDSVMNTAGSFGQKISNSLSFDGSGESGDSENSDESELEEIVTNYTLEEIKTDPKLYAIGYTKNEYVVASFNDDYTEVTITRNGEDSDGQMMRYAMKETGRRATLEKADIKKGVTRIEYGAFQECKALESVKIPDTVTFIGQQAFMYCSALKSVTIPNGVPNILDDTFAHCTSLTDVKLPEGLNKIKLYSFEGCTSLESIYIPASVVDINNTSFKDSALTTIYGKPDTYAENHAKWFKFTFIAV